VLENREEPLMNSTRSADCDPLRIKREILSGLARSFFARGLGEREARSRLLVAARNLPPPTADELVDQAMAEALRAPRRIRLEVEVRIGAAGGGR
jgi:hypothetical protein